MENAFSIRSDHVNSLFCLYASQESRLLGARQQERACALYCSSLSRTMDNGIAVRSMDSLPRALAVPNMEFLKVYTESDS